MSAAGLVEWGFFTHHVRMGPFISEQQQKNLVNFEISNIIANIISSKNNIEGHQLAIREENWRVELKPFLGIFCRLKDYLGMKKNTGFLTFLKRTSGKKPNRAAPTQFCPAARESWPHVSVPYECIRTI